jgi:hypothetical protein
MRKYNLPVSMQLLEKKKIEETKIINFEIKVQLYNGRIKEAEKFYKPISKIFFQV